MWSYEIQEKRRLVITTAWDVLTHEDVTEHRRQLKNDSRFSPDFFQLLDFTGVTAITIHNGTVNDLTRERIFSEKSRRAFLAPSPLTYGISRMFISLSQLSGAREQMAVFEKRNDALRWLFQRSTIDKMRLQTQRRVA